ncbi:UNVERIFIED_CONTAM: hypothetical protein FKN15_035297 [Acipenser sinensis]
MVLRYLAEDMAEIPAFQVPQWVELPSCEPEQVQLLSTEPEGEEPTLQSPELEEEEPPSPELEGEELQAHPPDFGGGRRAVQPSIAVGGAGSLSPAVGGAGSTTRTARGFLYCITWGSFVVDLWGVAGASLEVASLFTAAATPATPVAPPKDACLATPKDARAAPLRDTMSESPGVACCSTSPWEPPVAEYKGEVELPLPPSGPGAPLPSSPPEGPLPPLPPEGLLLPSRPEGPASPGVTASPEWQQEVLWPEPHKGELPTTTPVPQLGAWGLDPSAWDPGHPGSMSGTLVAGPDCQVAAPPGTGGRLVSCSAPPGCPDIAALSPGLASLPGATADRSPACAPNAPSNAPGSPFTRSRSRQEGAGLWTDSPSAMGEGGPPTMAAPMDHLLPLF